MTTNNEQKRSKNSRLMSFLMALEDVEEFMSVKFFEENHEWVSKEGYDYTDDTALLEEYENYNSVGRVDTPLSPQERDDGFDDDEGQYHPNSYYSAEEQALKRAELDAQLDEYFAR